MKQRGIIMMKLYLSICLLFSVSFIQTVCSDELIGSINEKTCTISSVSIPFVNTDCKQFVLSEQVKITDTKGKQLHLFEIPLPSIASIEYDCPTAETCHSIVSIKVLEVVKDVPE